MIFGRKVYVDLGVPGFQARRIKDLRINFTVNHTDESTPSHAEISIYNASEESIAEISKNGAVIRLFAGYDEARLVFEGSPVQGGIKSIKSGNDRILKIEALDGGRNYSNAIIQINLSGSATTKEVVNAAIESLGLPIGKVVATGSYPNGLTFSGAAHRLLDQAAKVSNAKWFIRSGAVFFIPINDVTGESSPLVSTDNGNLIGSPTITSDGVEVIALLDASIMQGRSVRVLSPSISGDFRITSVKIRGDSGWSPEFYSEFRAVPL